MSKKKEVDHAEALWTQALEGGIGADQGPIWIKVYEVGTKLKRRSTGQYISISEDAHIKNIESWKTRMSELVGHIDHNRDAEFNIGVSDIKYNPGIGLFFKMKPENETLRKGLFNGTIKPSIEVDMSEEDLKGGELVNYIPTGLGLMVNGTALGKDVGPSMPDFDTALGGETMTEKKKEDVDTFIGEIKTAFESDKEKFVAEKPTWDTKVKEFFGEKVPEEHNKVISKYFEDAKLETKKKPKGDDTIVKPEDETVKQLKEQLLALQKEKEDMNAKLEKLVNSEAQKTELENVLKKQYGEQIKALLETDYSWENKSLEKVKDDYLLVSMIETKRKKEMPKAGLPPVGGNPPPGSKKDFDKDGVVSDDRFKEIVAGLGGSNKQRNLVVKKSI